MALSLTLFLLAVGVFLMWLGLTGNSALPALRSIVTTGKVA